MSGIRLAVNPVPERASDGTWNCTNCGTRGTWGPGWHWYDNYVNGPERVLCPTCSWKTVTEVIEP